MMQDLMFGAVLVSISTIQILIVGFGLAWAAGRAREAFDDWRRKYLSQFRHSEEDTRGDGLAAIIARGQNVFRHRDRPRWLWLLGGD